MSWTIQLTTTGGRMEAKRRIQRITKRTVDAAVSEARPFRLWDTELKGFGLAVMPSGVKTYLVWYRVGTGRNATRREYTIARHGEMTPDEARSEAGKVLGRVRLGEDPQANRKRSRLELNVASLCDLYLADGVALKKPATVLTDEARIRAHIKPLLGQRPISAVTSADVARFLRDVAVGKTAAKPRPTAAQVRIARSEFKANGSGTPKALSEQTAQLVREHGVASVKDFAKIETRARTDPAGKGGRGTATRTLGLLGSIFSFAVREGLRADNPVAGVERFRDGQSQRFLSADELSRLAATLNQFEAAGANASGLAVIRLLTLTGARKGEIEGLRWTEVDFGRACLRLADSKTGARMIPLGAAALKCLEGIPKSQGSPFLFPGEGEVRAGEPPRHYIGTPKLWLRVRAAASLDNVRLHDLRHTFASFGAAGGLSLPVIGQLLGHRDVKTTAQYAHLADDPLRMGVERIAGAISGAMAGSNADIRPLRRETRGV